MKTTKQKIKGLIIVTFMVLTSVGSAQTHKGDIIVSAGTGKSVIGLAYSYSDKGNRCFPLNLNADYLVKDNLSVGLATTYEVFGKFSLSPAKGDVSRLNVSARVLYSFYNKEKISWYFGGRTGISRWNIDSETHVLPSFQFVCGTRIAIEDGIGLNLETAFGSPYFLSAGLYFNLQ